MDKPDLSQLRIDERSRKGGRMGKALGLFATVVGALVVVVGLVFALKDQKPSVELATVRVRGLDRDAPWKNLALPAVIPAKTYPVSVENGDIYVEVEG